MKIPNENLFFKIKRFKNFLPLILKSKFLKYPIKGQHIELSLVATTHDDNARPSERLIDLSLKAISFARDINLEKIAHREIKAGSHKTVTIYPGEHYRLLCGFVKALSPKIVLEFGTGKGLSALCMKQFIGKGKIVTFDVIGWQDMTGTYLNEDDFSDGKIMQYTDNLSDGKMFDKHKEMISNAELIFLDGPKDGITEYKLMKKLENVKFKKLPVLFLDDIRTWHMLKLWRDISCSKIDLVSFGHWSGSGVVELETKKRTN